jgi:tetratricopeptide (TPR) repeat protein
MTETHPTPEALEQFLLGQLSSSEMREIARHLLNGCPECQQSMACLWESTEEEEEVSLAEAEAEVGRNGYDDVLDRVFARVVAAEAAIEEQKIAGRKLLAELMQVPEARRHLLASNSQRFRNRMLCECLIEEGHEAGFDDPRRAVAVAKLATLVADRLKAEECGGEEALNGLRARAWAQLGNAYRLVSDLASAEQAFTVAESSLEEGPVSLLDRARVLVLRASLRLDQHSFPEALQLFDRGAFIYRKLGQWHLLGRAFLQKALVCYESGDREGEMKLLRRALDLIDPQADPRVFLAARHSLINALNDSGRSREAFALLFHTRPLYLKAGDRMSLLKLRWLEGLVALGLRRIEQAEAALREVRDAFMELDLGYDAALASLDLANVYIVQGNTQELRRIAEETLAAFRAHHAHQEAIAALLALCEAARLDRAELELIREISDFLKRSRSHPDARFFPSS